MAIHSKGSSTIRAQKGAGRLYTTRARLLKLTTKPVAPKPPPDPPIAPWVVNQNPLWSIGWVCFSYLVGSLAKRTNINISLWSLYHPGWGVCWICPTTIELDREQTHTVFAIQCFVEKVLMYFILKAPRNVLPSRGIVVMVDFSAHRPSNYNEVR